MKINMKGTKSADVALRLAHFREEGRASAIGRVLTLVAVVRDDAFAEHAIHAASEAARSHPCRIIVIKLPPEVPVDGVTDEMRTNGYCSIEDSGLDAMIIVGAEAGASELVILHPRGCAADSLSTLVTPLLLPEAPVVTWWLGEIPTFPAATDLGMLSNRRLTTAVSCTDPIDRLMKLAKHYTPGDTDFAWAGVTMWRGFLASMLDEPPFLPVERVEVEGCLSHPSVHLLAEWLKLRLQCPTAVVEGKGTAIDTVRMFRSDGVLELERPIGTSVGIYKRPGHTDQRVRLPMRTEVSMLVEELRIMRPDSAYAEVLESLIM